MGPATRFARGIGVTAFAIAISATSLVAHHSMDETYDLSRTVTLTGVISRTEWVNPHVRLSMEVKLTDGTVTTWSLEGGAPNTLRQSGLSPSMFTQNDQVSVDVWVARNGSSSAAVQRLRLSGGRTFESGLVDRIR